MAVPKLFNVEVPVKQYPKPVMFLREGMITAEGEGVRIDLYKNINGDCLIFEVCRNNTPKQFVISSRDLIAAIDTLEQETRDA